jgi:hypothetical protein
VNRLLNKIKDRAPPQAGAVEKAMHDGKLTPKQYDQIVEVRKAWQDGEIAVGCGAVANEILAETGVDFNRNTLSHWLGRKGKNRVAKN